MRSGAPSTACPARSSAIRRRSRPPSSGRCAPPSRTSGARSPSATCLWSRFEEGRHDRPAQSRRHRRQGSRRRNPRLPRDARSRAVGAARAARARRHRRVRHAPEHQDRAPGAARRELPHRRLSRPQPGWGHPPRLLRGRGHPRGARPARSGRRSVARVRRAPDRGSRQARAFPAPEGLPRHAGRAGAGLTGLSSLVRAVAGSLPATIVAVIGFGLLAMGAGVLGFGLRATGAAALYFVVWWIGLFAVLPFGVRSQAEDEDVVVGSEPGAPSAPALREKAVWTSLLATVVFVAAGALPA